jgi:phosphoribosyl-AMP cyclohydrolase
MTNFTVMNIAFDKFTDGLVPAIIQDAKTLKVLMLGYMNEDAFEKTLATGQVTFFSRSKSRLWTKGEESGNFLQLVAYHLDCDNDALLLIPVGTRIMNPNNFFSIWNRSLSKEKIQQMGALMLNLFLKKASIKLRKK